MFSETKIKTKSILEKYFGDVPLNSFRIDKMSLGICNETYKVNCKKDNFVLQKLNNMALADLMRDFIFLSQELNGLGWNVPVLLKSSSALNFIEDNNNIWRIYKFIPGKTIDELKTINYISLGKLLAELHRDLKKINYYPHFSIPNFHNSIFFINSLKKIFRRLKDKELISIAKKIIKAYNHSNNISSKKVQLIHGDPRTENYLFNTQGEAFSIIDFDTFMRGSIFIDIGDLLRSISLSENQTNSTFSESRIEDTLAGYLSANKIKDNKKFIVDAIDGMKQITLELCSRFLIDVIENKYFGWDSEKYKSRRENNTIRALAQWKLFKETEKLNLNNLIQSVRIKANSLV